MKLKINKNETSFPLRGQNIPSNRILYASGLKALGFPAYAGSFQHGLVRGIALVSNAGHPHDPHAENPLHPQPRLMAARPAHHAGHCHGNNYSPHLGRKTSENTEFCLSQTINKIGC